MTIEPALAGPVIQGAHERSCGAGSGECRDQRARVVAEESGADAFSIEVALAQRSWPVNWAAWEVTSGRIAVWRPHAHRADQRAGRPVPMTGHVVMPVTGNVRSDVLPPARREVFEDLSLTSPRVSHAAVDDARAGITIPLHGRNANILSGARSNAFRTPCGLRRLCRTRN